MVASPLSVDRDAIDTQMDDAVGNLDVGDLAHLLAEESLGDGGVDGNLALAQIGLILAHDGIGHLSLVGHVGHFDLAHNLYSVGAETRHIYYLGLGDG